MTRAVSGRRPSFAGRLTLALLLLVALPLPALVWLTVYRAGDDFRPDLVGPAVALGLVVAIYGGLAIVSRRYRETFAARRWLLAPMAWSLLVYGAVWLLCSHGNLGSVASADLLTLALALASPALGYALAANVADARDADTDAKTPRPRWRRNLVIGWLVVLAAIPLLGALTLRLCTGFLDDAELAADDRRDLAHFCIGSGVMRHDAYLLLTRAGDESSVPVLIDGLSRAPRDADFYECTWLHLVEALETITGQRHGLSHADWSAWYAEHGDESREEWLAAARED